MNPRPPYPSPYGVPTYHMGAAPQKVPARPVYYEGQPYYQPPVSMFQPPGPPSSYQPTAPPVYPHQQPPYYGNAYQKPVVYAEQQASLYVPPPPPPPETTYVGYTELPPQLYARANPPIQVQKPQPVPQPAQPVAIAKPPIKRERQTARPADELPDLSRQTVEENDAPPGEFDMVTRGRLPAILFQSEVTIKT